MAPPTPQPAQAVPQIPLHTQIPSRPDANPPTTGRAPPPDAPDTPNSISSGHPVPAQEDLGSGPTPISTAAEQPASSSAAPIELTQAQTRAVLKKGRSEIIRIMITTTAVPHHLKWQDMYLDAISASIQAVVGGAVVNKPEGYVRVLSLAMRDVRHHVKAHCVHNVQHVYGLCLEDGGDGYVDMDLEFEHCARRARELSNGDFSFLRDNPSHLYFTSTYFKHLVLDMLTNPPYSLAGFVTEVHMDNVFALCGTAILAALDDYVEGYVVNQHLNADVWRRYYIPIIGLIGKMRESEVEVNWLEKYQRNLLNRARARLHRRTLPTRSSTRTRMDN